MIIVDMLGIPLEVGIHGGVQIKLKLGKNETAPSKDDTIAQKTPEIKEPPKPAEQPEKKPEPERQIIKFDTKEKPTENKKEELPQEPKKKMTTETKKPEATRMDTIPDVTKIVGDKPPAASADAAREELEQRRTILQNMKDFDFQIKKNQEDLTNISEKVENLSKDLDDLVSLYEIVSEQMNPFVGLSKVTKKRLDALENFTKEVDSVKTRIGDLESVLEKNGLNSSGVTTQLQPRAVTETKKEVKTTPTIPTISTPTPPTTVRPSTETNLVPQNPASAVSTPSIKTTMIQPPNEQSLSDKEIDELLSKSLESLFIEQNIDTMISEFLLSLK